MITTVDRPTVGDRCGTYAGWNKHKRRREPVCGPCRAAATAYQRNRRAANLAGYIEEKRLARARDRAAWRLVDNHRDEWRRLVVEELDKP